MRIYFGVTGPERKELVQAVSDALNTRSKYLGPPSFAYQVGDYQIDRDGVLEGPNNEELVLKLNQSYSLDFKGNPAPDESLLTIKMPNEGFTEQALENLERLVASKETLIKKAIGADSLPIIKGEETLEFPWFSANAIGDEVEAYTAFVQGICALAKKRQRITAQERDVNNEKYSFRVFLIQLGFVGEDYKKARKILMKNLTGNSAFRDGYPPKKEVTSNDGIS